MRNNAATSGIARHIIGTLWGTAMSIPTIAAALTFICTPIAVYDGDGPVWCAEGPRLRLSGIAAREMEGTCRPGHPCPQATAEQARDALVALLGGSRGTLATGHIVVRAPAMRCVSTGEARGNRTGAWCTLADGRDLSCAMVATGTVLRWQRYWGNHRCP